MAMTREEFNRAFTEVVSMEFADVSTKENEIVFKFSENFLRRMDNLIALQQAGGWWLLSVFRKHIAVIVIFILGVTISACGINQIITNFDKVQRKEIQTDFYEKVTAKEITSEYVINDIPDGFEKVWLSRNTGCIDVAYENDEGDDIFFWQGSLKVIDGIDTTQYKSSEKYLVRQSSKVVRGLDVEIYENEHLVGAIWIEDGYYMELTYEGCEDVEEVISMIESIRVSDER